MKAIHYILITVILIGAGFGIYFLKEKKKKEIKAAENNPQNDKNNIPAKNPNKPKHKYLYPEYFKKSKAEILTLQKNLNNVLRLHNKPLIKTDGLYGPKTENALIYYISVKNHLPKAAPIDDNEGNTYVVDFGKVAGKIYEIGKDVSGYALLKNLFS